jgi:hypothetical protein
MHWTLAQLQSYVDDGIPEGTSLEYKASRLFTKSAWAEDLAVEVASLANAAGGVLIIGIPAKKDRHGKFLPEPLDEGIDLEYLDIDRLHQVLNSRIQPRIAGIEIHRILAGESKGYLIFAVPQSQSNAPHQTTHDRLYHQRYGTENRIMEDYMIRDAMRRAQSPDLRVVLQNAQGEAPARQFLAPAPTGQCAPIHYHLGVRAANNEPCAIYMLRVFFELGGMRVMKTWGNGDYSHGTVWGLRVDGRGGQYSPYVYNHVADYLPVFGDTPESVAVFAVLYDVVAVGGKGRSWNVFWDLRAPHMQSRRGRYRLIAENGWASFEDGGMEFGTLEDFITTEPPR